MSVVLKHFKIFGGDPKRSTVENGKDKTDPSKAADGTATAAAAAGAGAGATGTVKYSYLTRSYCARNSIIILSK